MPSPATARRDPAETKGYLRFFYRDWRPTRLGRMWSRAFAWMTGMGLLRPVLTALQVRNRTTGRVESTVLVVASYQGERYLVSMLGNDSEWVKNVRAANGEVSIKRGSSQQILLTEIPPEERAPVLKAWCQVASSGRRHLPVAPDAPVDAFFPIAMDYPVFRVDPR